MKKLDELTKEAWKDLCIGQDMASAWRMAPIDSGWIEPVRRFIRRALQWLKLVGEGK